MVKQFLVVKKDRTLSEVKKSLIRSGVKVEKITLAKKDKRLEDSGFKGVNIFFKR